MMVQVIGKWLGRALLVCLAVAIVVGLWKREEITRLLAVNSLFDADRIVSNFSNMDQLFLTAPLPRGEGPVSELPDGTAMEPPAGFQAWLDQRSVTGVLVLKDGSIRHEAYLAGTKREDRRIGWSISKSYISALIGILLDDGRIGSLDDRAADYALALAGSAYDDVSIRDLLEMTSGVTFDEDYLDRTSDINRMGRELALGGEMDVFAATLEDRFAPPGEQWQYTSIDTHALAMVLRAASGQTIPELLSKHITGKLGHDSDGFILTDGVGVAFALGGLNLTLRDYARFGLMISQDGVWQGEPVVPADWIAQSTQPNGKTKPGDIQYGSHWWMPSDAAPGEFMGRGIYGQYLYINKDNQTVIAVTSADRAFREAGVTDQTIDMLRAIVAAVEDD